MKINEIFRSIQGESTYAGFPCAFVRLAGCNLRCTYCDTTYAYDSGTEMTTESVVEALRRFGTKLVEITGGEPLLQEREVLELINLLTHEGHRVLLETNGSMDIGNLTGDIIRIIDIKCPDSGMTDRMRWDNLEKLRPTDELKFVLSSRRDYEWARALVQERSLADRVTVLFSPAFGILDAKLLAGWLCEDRLEVRLQLQIHKLIWAKNAGGV